MNRVERLYKAFREEFPAEPTVCQDNLLRSIAEFSLGDDTDILVINGYAGTGKTTAISAVINAFYKLNIHSVLLAPTGRAAKVMSVISGHNASTIHKHIYRQKSVNESGQGLFQLSYNKSRDTLFVVDEVSLIGVDSEAKSTALFGTGNLLTDLIEYVRSGSNCRLILIGDCAQLPPVGLYESPALSREYMSVYGDVRFENLTTVVRQASESGILRNATTLRELISNCNSGFISASELFFNIEDCNDIERVSGADLIETLSDAYSRYGAEDTMVLCRSNKRANRYNAGIRAHVLFREEELLRDDRLMIVRNCYKFVEDIDGLDYIANGDIAILGKMSNVEERYGLHFADAILSFPDYDYVDVQAKICLDTLSSESASLTSEQQNALYQGVAEDYSSCKNKKKRYAMVREDPYYNALQIKHAEAITCHKSQGGQWRCVFIDNPFWQDEYSLDDLKWMYTALTRAVEKVYLVNFKDQMFR